jgi:sulfonate transport system permease protein
MRRTLRRFGSTLIILAAWEIASRSGLLSPRLLAGPDRVVSTTIDLLRSGTLERNLLVSLARVAVGMSIAILVAVPLGFIAGLSRLGEDVVDAPLQMARTLPHLALVPLFILWFGIGETPKIVLVALGAAFPIYLNLVAGIRGVDPKLVEMARVHGLSRGAVIREVVLPASLPSLLVGLRYAFGVGWLSLVVGEQIAADSGIGFMMMDAREFLRTDIIVVGLVIYALLGTATDQLVRLMEHRMLAWRPLPAGRVA